MTALVYDFVGKMQRFCLKVLDFSNVFVDMRRVRYYYLNEKIKTEVVIMATGLPASKRHNKKFTKPLQFGCDGKFKILHLTDIHEVDPEMDDDEDKNAPQIKTMETMNVIEKCIDFANPDLVVFGGDNISGFWREFTYDYMYKTIRRIVEPVEKRGIPLAIVFGNHDAECESKLPFLMKENQIAVYAEYGNFRNTFNDEDVSGCGNCSLPILSSDGSRTAWNIWCIDSNDYVRDERYNVIGGAGYGFVQPDQLEWYERQAAKLKSDNGGKTVPSILFQHIPVLQEYNILTETAADADGAVEHCGKYYAAPDSAFLDGEMREAPCPPDSHGEEFESWKKTGDIKAAFFGHDHINTFTAIIDGIKLVQTPGAGFHTYGDKHGGRLIVLDENKPDKVESEVIFIEPLYEKKENQNG